MVHSRGSHKRQAIRSLGHLGFVGENLRCFKELVHLPLGFGLVTGPTGSGKTTTLYTAIDAINTMGKDILPIEAPVESSSNSSTRSRYATLLACRSPVSYALCCGKGLM